MEFEPTLLFSNDESTPSFGHEDLMRILKSKTNSAPGWDNLQYDFYKNCTSVTGFICQIINRILQGKVVPSSFKLATLALIHKGKGADVNEPKSFRPICLTSTFSKIFTTFLANHASVHMLKNKFFADSQKAYIKGLSGVVEHHATLEAALDFLASGKGKKDQMVLILTDISNAFGSVSHNLIIFALEYYSFPRWFIDIVRSLYTDLFIKITDSEGKSEHVKQLIGVFQGDPLSAILFIIVMNLGIQAINNDKFIATHGVQIYPASFDMNRKISNLSFSDDIVPTVKSIDSAKETLEMLDKFSE
jgi:hypothetical protein